MMPAGQNYGVYHEQHGAQARVVSQVLPRGPGMPHVNAPPPKQYFSPGVRPRQILTGNGHHPMGHANGTTVNGAPPPQLVGNHNNVPRVQVTSPTTTARVITSNNGKMQLMGSNNNTFSNFTRGGSSGSSTLKTNYSGTVSAHPLGLRPAQRQTSGADSVRSAASSSALAELRERLARERQAMEDQVSKVVKAEVEYKIAATEEKERVRMMSNSSIASSTVHSNKHNININQAAVVTPQKLEATLKIDDLSAIRVQPEHVTPAFVDEKKQVYNRNYLDTPESARMDAEQPPPRPSQLFNKGLQDGQFNEVSDASVAKLEEAMKLCHDVGRNKMNNNVQTRFNQHLADPLGSPYSNEHQQVEGSPPYNQRGLLKVASSPQQQLHAYNNKMSSDAGAMHRTGENNNYKSLQPSSSRFLAPAHNTSGADYTDNSDVEIASALNNASIMNSSMASDIMITNMPPPTEDGRSMIDDQQARRLSHTNMSDFSSPEKYNTNTYRSNNNIVPMDRVEEETEQQVRTLKLDQLKVLASSTSYEEEDDDNYMMEEVDGRAHSSAPEPSARSRSKGSTSSNGRGLTRQPSPPRLKSLEALEQQQEDHFYNAPSHPPRPDSSRSAQTDLLPGFGGRAHRSADLERNNSSRPSSARRPNSARRGKMGDAGLVRPGPANATSKQRRRSASLRKTSNINENDNNTNIPRLKQDPNVQGRLSPPRFRSQDVSPERAADSRADSKASAASQQNMGLNSARGSSRGRRELSGSRSNKNSSTSVQSPRGSMIPANNKNNKGTSSARTFSNSSRHSNQHVNSEVNKGSTRPALPRSDSTGGASSIHSGRGIGSNGSQVRSPRQNSTTSNRPRSPEPLLREKLNEVTNAIHVRKSPDWLRTNSSCKQLIEEKQESPGGNPVVTSNKYFVNSLRGEQALNKTKTRGPSKIRGALMGEGEHAAGNSSVNSSTYSSSNNNSNNNNNNTTSAKPPLHQSSRTNVNKNKESTTTVNSKSRDNNNTSKPRLPPSGNITSSRSDSKRAVSKPLNIIRDSENLATDSDAALALEQVETSFSTIRSHGLETLRALLKNDNWRKLEPYHLELIKRVLIAVCLMLGVTDVRWDNVVKLVLDVRKFGSLLRNWDIETMEPEFYAEVRDNFLSHRDFDEDTVREANVDCCLLAHWVRSACLYLYKTKYMDGAKVSAPRYMRDDESIMMDPGTANDQYARSPSMVESAPSIDYDALEADNKVRFVISPDLDEVEDLSRVENLLVTLPDVGEVFWPGLTDCRNLNLWRHIKLDIGEVLVYPDASSKPLKGEGLNKHAKITLYQCFSGPQTGEEVDPRVEEEQRRRIKEMTERKSAIFIDYSSRTGVWKFEVENFC